MVACFFFACGLGLLRCVRSLMADFVAKGVDGFREE
jgi:hypothetical protein